MSIASDIKRKRKQQEREVAKVRARQHKIHRFAFAGLRVGSQLLKTSERSIYSSACGLWTRSRTGTIGSPAVDDHAFSCLPAEAQCRNCRLIEPRAFRDKWRPITEATDEERIAIEVVLHAFAAFCVAWGEAT